MMASNSINKDYKRAGVHPLKFTLWLMIVSIIMMFAAFTSAYIVRREEGNWLEFNIPNIFLINTILIVLSSIALQWAYISAKKDNIGNLKIGLILTFALGMAFLGGQWLGWGELVQNKVYFGGMSSNPSGSFFYVLTGVHAFHLITGLLFLFIVVISAFRFKIHSKKLLRLELCAIYWHFLGGLWIYLYGFLLLNH